MTRRIVLDMDVGIDDAIAILYLAGRADAQIVALGSVFGNIDTPQTTRNAIAVFEHLGLGDVPVAEGAHVPLRVPLSLADFVHGADGLGEIGVPAIEGRATGESAADQLVRLSAEAPGELDLLAVGPLTNLAIALQRDRHVLARYRSVVIMGGSGLEEWNDAGQEYDANITNDPDAADAVFAAAGANLVMVGVNVTSPTVLDEVSIERLAASDTPAARFATRILPFYLDFYERRHARRVASMHDPLAAGILLDPTLVTGFLSAPVGVLRMETCWRAVAPRHPGLDVPGRPRTQVVTEVDGRRFVEGLVESLAAPARAAGAVR